jgi:hypothetical protein
MQAEAEKRIKAIKASLESFVFSLFSLLPILGLAFVVPAVILGRKAMRLTGADWNPAQGYLKIARWLTVLGFFVSVACLALIIPAISIIQGMDCSPSGSS